MCLCPVTSRYRIPPCINSCSIQINTAVKNGFLARRFSKGFGQVNSASGKIIVTPGVRPEGSDLGDQKRVSSPSDAIKNGANHIVVGRPVIKSSNPKRAAKDILNEINR